MRSLLGRFHRPMSRGAMGDMLTMNSLGDGSTLNLDFTTGVLDSRLTFTRSTTATYINSSGYVTSAAINAPRFDYSPTNTGEPRGLLIEGQTSNILSYSTETSNAYWQKYLCTISGTLAYAPDNTTSARLVIEDSGSVEPSLQRTSNTVDISSAYTLSVWFKAPTSNARRYMNLRINDNSSNANAASLMFDSQTGTISGAATAYGTITAASGNVVPYPGSWYRVSLTFTIPASGITQIACKFQMSGAGTRTGDGSASPYTGDGVSGMYVWGTQLEKGSGASSYIPTGASTVTRTLDTAIIAAGTNFSSWYTGGTTGTFVTEWCRCSLTTTQRTVIATNDLPNQHLHQYIAATTSRLRLADNVPAFIETANASVNNSINKGAFSYAGSVQSLCLNGGTVVPGTLTFTTAPTWLSIGGPSNNGTSITDTAVVLNNAIRKIKYFPARLSDAQIKEITT